MIPHAGRSPLSTQARSTGGVTGGASTAVAIDGVVTHHLNPFRSGVSRFNQMLGERLGVPCYGVLDPQLTNAVCPLMSFKVGELGEDERTIVAELVAARRRFCLFLHDFCGSDLERALVAQSAITYCGNDEIRTAVDTIAPHTETLWAPGLIVDTRRYERAELTVFSFGMAHKIQVDWFRRLRELLKGTGKSFALYLSNANHETARLEDAEIVHEELDRIFPTGLYFTGNLSDVAIYNWLLDATFFAAFFPKGARANNTSIASAMERGAVVITNLDQHSPANLRHLETVIDIRQCDALPTDASVLRDIRTRAKAAATERSWDALTRAILSHRQN